MDGPRTKLQCRGVVTASLSSSGSQFEKFSHLLSSDRKSCFQVQKSQQLLLKRQEELSGISDEKSLESLENGCFQALLPPFLIVVQSQFFSFMVPGSLLKVEKSLCIWKCRLALFVVHEKSSHFAYIYGLAPRNFRAQVYISPRKQPLL